MSYPGPYDPIVRDIDRLWLEDDYKGFFRIAGMTLETMVKVNVKNVILCLFSNVIDDICHVHAILYRFAIF